MSKKVTIFQSKKSKIFLHNSYKTYKQVEFAYKQICKRTKRQPYVRSAYFNKEKIFLSLFWQHIKQKRWPDRLRRLRYFDCAIDLLEHSYNKPIVRYNVQKPSEKLYRFTGKTAEGEIFYVQVKEQKKTNQKFFMSVFPQEK